MRVAASCVLAVCLVNAQPKSQEGKYVGAKACGSCHASQFAQQSASGHAQSLRLTTEHPLAGSFFPDAPILREPKFRFQFSRSSGQFVVEISDEKGAMTAPIQWAFGAANQAVTFVSQLNEDWYVEHHFSYYSSIKSLDVTPGHEHHRAANLQEAIGVLYKTFDPEPKIMRCFQCHSTGRLSLGPKLDIRPGESGVRCEACHGPGSLHVETAGRSEIEAARKLITNPGRKSAADLNQSCGACHRKPAPATVATDWNDPWNTRHQPLYLSQSVCFRKSRGALSCLTCHDPHQELRKNDAPYYNLRCSACHNRKPHSAIKAIQAGKQADCISCHMPRVTPHAHLRFTNHWIAVYRDGATLKPSQSATRP
jgi:hypothetical protein